MKISPICKTDLKRSLYLFQWCTLTSVICTGGFTASRFLVLFNYYIFLLFFYSLFSFHTQHAGDHPYWFKQTKKTTTRKWKNHSSLQPEFSTFFVRIKKTIYFSHYLVSLFEVWRKKQTNVETCGNLVTICKNSKQNTKPPTETDVCASTLLHHSCVAVHNIIMFLVYFLYIHLWMKALNVNIYWIFKCYGQQSKNPFKK